MKKINNYFKLPLLIICFLIIVSLAYAREHWEGEPGLEEPIWRNGSVGIGRGVEPDENAILHLKTEEEEHIRLIVYKEENAFISSYNDELVKRWTLNMLNRSDHDKFQILYDDPAIPYFTLTLDGNIGIGTTEPEHKLDIVGGIRVNDYIRANNNSGLKFKTDEGTTRLTIADDGNVGIGGFSPFAAPQAPLHIWNSSGDLIRLQQVTSTDHLNIGSFDYNANNIWSIDMLDTYNCFSINYQNDFPSFRIFPNGNITIGHESPMEPLHQLHIDGGICLDNYIQSSYDNGMHFKTNDGTTRLTITDNGNVGIGTTSPEAKLHVDGSVEVDGSMGEQNLKVESSVYIHSDTYTFIKGNLQTFNPAFSTFLGKFKDEDDSGFFNYGAIISSNFNANGMIGLRVDVLENNIAATFTGGNVGIGTSNPSTALHIEGDSQPLKLLLNNNGDQSSYIELKTACISADLGIIFNNTEESNVGTISWEGDGSFAIMGGNVGIGTENPQSELAVNGKITTTEIEVTLTGWSDFVFNSNYDLKSLDEVEQFIIENGHLPEIPSAEEVKENGLNLGNMQSKLLQKIEELTLYLIDMQKENKELKDRISSLETTE